METAQLLEAMPGDLILWDSRTVHGGLVGAGCDAPEGALGSSKSRVCVCVCGCTQRVPGICIV